MLKESLEGHQFGRLIVLCRAKPKRLNKGTFWLCVCDCGKRKVVRRDALISKKTTSCGCFGRERLAATRGWFKHGHAKVGNASKEYRAWQAIKRRCYYRNGKDWPDYGGRGITVCNRWLNSFPNFLIDIGQCPPGLQLDRKDNDKGYSPNNCHWTTGRRNCNNKRNNRKITFRGKTLTVTEWGRKLGVPIPTLFSRIYAGNKLPEEIFRGYC